MSPRTARICLDHVSLSYDGKTDALADVSLSIAPGERVCLLGANGSGKSTLAGIVSGLLAPDAGTVELAGRRVCTEGVPDPDAYRLARRSLGLVFQNPDDQIVTTVVSDDVAFGPENLGLAPDEIGRRVTRELDRVALSAYADADPTHLSGGQKQRVAIAGALAMEPQVLVLDEPGALLDVRGRRSIMHVISRLHDAGTTVLHVTHFMDEALDAERVIVLDHGRIIADDSPTAVFADGERLSALGLELPFAARLSAALCSRGLEVGWTCERQALVSELVARDGIR